MSRLPVPDGGPVDARRARRVLLTAIALSAVLLVLPGGAVVGYPLLLLSTYVHEMGHGLAAELVGGDFVELRVFGDGSGVALTATGGRLSRAIVSAGGLVGPALASAVGFLLARRARTARAALVVGGGLLLVATALWARGVVGLLVGLALAASCLAIGVYGRRAGWSQLWLVFLSVQLGLSVFSRGEYLFASGATTGAGRGLSDSAAIGQALVGPYWFWGAVCGLVSVAALAVGSWAYLRAATSDLDVDGR